MALTETDGLDNVVLIENENKYVKNKHLFGLEGYPAEDIQKIKNFLFYL